ncbi:MAG: DUF5123 domain-containing protein [Kiritimatiellaeota bacterium]|nr:DUF5123 domain-containing protein [Kiritimatiellota bacterium]
MNKRSRTGRVAHGVLAMLALIATTTATHAATYYVSPNGNNGNALSWATAKTTIQAAINLAVNAGDEVVVTNGTYGVISVTDNRRITIRSVNGAGVTIIDGGNANRCAMLGSSTAHTNTVLTGFTLRNGLCNSSSFGGGGSCFGTLNNCVLAGNTTGSTHGTRGGGAYYGVLNNCTLTGNTVSFPGSTGMPLATYGGGAYYSTLNNCILTRNTASAGYGSANGGGAYGGTLNNCTLSENRAKYGGGVRSCTLNNCVVWGNTASNVAYSNSIDSVFWYSCAAPLPSGTGNIASNPLFVDAANGDFRLQPDSPCINKGNNAYVVGNVDLDGNPRILDGTVDMGAYESVFLTLNYGAWRTYHTLPDTTVNSNKWLAGLAPLNPNAKVTARIEMRDGMPYVDWVPDLRPLRSYTKEMKEHLSDPWQPAPEDLSTLPLTPSRFFRVKVALP